tara:strand:+ start:1028 stop:1411 length:384 start_codon:yes stop_codon:yes gene_type:complete
MDNVLEHITSRERRDGDAVMFDIDDTLINSQTGKVIPHVKSLLDMCKQLGYKIVIITARAGDSVSQDYTEKELTEHNIRYDFLGYCDPDTKSYLKQYLMKKEGWHFVLSVGDMWTDLTDSDIYLLVQ